MTQPRRVEIPASTPTCISQARQFKPSTPEVFGTLFAEVVLPDGETDAPVLPGWEVRLWPVARLGDATLEARPLVPYLSGDDLNNDLTRLGWSVLGPVRARR